MKMTSAVAGVFATCLCVPALAGDPPPAAPPEMAGAPGPSHKLLEGMVGTWSVAGRFWMAPGKPPVDSAGTATNTARLGGRWIQQDYVADFMGQPFHGIGFTGYDNLAQAYVSTWMDDQMTMVMVTTGRYDEAAKTLTFTGEHADGARPGTKAKMREVVRFVSADQHVFEMYEAPAGAAEVKVMELTYTRKK